ncbi:MAG: ATP-binding protein [Chloroflexota bacterium]|nr:ATP-binding protein [Chloroflexota bacterium]
MTIFVAAVLATTLAIPTLWRDRAGDLFWILAVVLLFVFPYTLVRYGHVSTGKLIMTVIAVIAIMGMGVMFGGEPGADNLYYLMVVSLFSASFLSLTHSIIITIVTSIITLTVMPALLGVSMLDVARGPFSFNIIAATFALIIVYYWREQQRVRQSLLRESETRYRVLTELASDYHYYYRLNADGSRDRLLTTDAFESLSGYRRADVPNDNLDLLVHPDDLPELQRQRARVRQGERVETVFRLRHKDGYYRLVRSIRVPDWDAAHHHVIGYYGVLIDQTESQKAEEERIKDAVRREQFAIVHEFVRALSHDFRNRLTIIENNRYLIGKTVEEAIRAKLEPRLSAIQSAMNQMGEQLDNLRFLTSLYNPTLKAGDLQVLSPFILDRVRSKVMQFQRELRIESSSVPLPTLFDENQLAQAIEQLVDNALAYTDSGGVITLRTRQDGAGIAIEVIDDGMGIAAEQIPHLCTPFYKGDNNSARSIRFGGLGIGLTIVKMIVETHRGKIEVESQVNEGTTVRLLLPQHQREDILSAA